MSYFHFYRSSYPFDKLYHFRDYFYLGYLIGNEKLQVKITNAVLYSLLIISICLQIIEGYWYLTMGDNNCGTQLKLTAILTGCIFALLAYRYIISDSSKTNKCLVLLGNKSFGIYFSHLAIMFMLERIPFYTTLAIYPLNAVITVIASFAFVMIGGRILGRFAKYFALQ